MSVIRAWLVSLSLWFSVVVAVVMSPSGLAATIEVEIDQETLQTQLDEIFPVTRIEPLVKVSVLQPEVLLNAVTDRIGLRVALLAELPDAINLTGVAMVDSRLRYEPKFNALYLDDPKIRFLEIDGVPEAVAQEVRAIGNALLRKHLNNTPIYLLGSRGIPLQESARLTGVSVREGKLILDLAMVD